MDLHISQNFINKPELVSKLITKANITNNDVVYDIGAGKGAITVELAKSAKKVVAFEFDRNLEVSLKNVIKDLQNVELIMGDFLKYPLSYQGDYKVFSNIPFSVTSDIVTKLVFAKNPPIDSFLIMQKEAVLRFMGIGEGTMLSLLIKPYFKMEIIHQFEPEDFSPKPSVGTVLFRIKRLETPLLNPIHAEEYRAFIIYALWQQKPTLKLRLNKVFTSAQFDRLSCDLNFDKDIKASDLSLDKWVKLFAYYLIGVSPEKKLLVYKAPKGYDKTNKRLNKVKRTKVRL